MDRLDYLLNVAVGISAGVGAIISTIPVLQPHTLALCLLILMILTIVNLRGMREAGVLLMIPTWHVCWDAYGDRGDGSPQSRRVIIRIPR
jgi:hypothetical protein